MPTAAATTATGAVEAMVAGMNHRADSQDVDDGDEDDEEDEEEDVMKVICERIRAQMQRDWEEALERATRDEGYYGIVRLTKA